MTPQQKRKLERLPKALDEAQTIIRELLHESSSDVEHEPASEFDSRAILASLRTVERGTAEERLGAMKQHELPSSTEIRLSDCLCAIHRFGIGTTDV